MCGNAINLQVVRLAAQTWRAIPVSARIGLQQDLAREYGDVHPSLLFGLPPFVGRSREGENLLSDDETPALTNDLQVLTTGLRSGDHDLGLAELTLLFEAGLVLNSIGLRHGSPRRRVASTTFTTPSSSTTIRWFGRSSSPEF